MPTTPPRTRLLAAPALALAAILAGAAPAAAATKPVGPSLVIESKACNTGADASQRSIVLTASAVLRGVGDEVQMRFSVQSRATLKTTWRSVFAKTGDLGTWATSDAGADGLRYTKVINGLSEGTQYRVLVDARAVDDNGKVVTRQTRRTYTCIQPQYSPKVVIEKWSWGPAPGSTDPNDASTLSYTLRNVGRQPSDPLTLALTQPDGTATTVPLDGVAAGRRVKGSIAATCPSVLSTFLAADYGKADAVAMDTAAITCPTAATKARRAARR